MDSKTGLGTLDVIGIVFVVLKLLDVISWSWWWVLCPFWIQLVVLVVALIILAL